MTGHIRAQCRSTSNSGGGVSNSAAHPKNVDGEEISMLLALTERKPQALEMCAVQNDNPKESCNTLDDGGDGDGSAWILDSGSSRHLITDAALLLDTRRCSRKIAMANATRSSLSRLSACGFV